MATRKALASSNSRVVDAHEGDLDTEYQIVEDEPDDEVVEDDAPAIPDDLVFTSDVEEQPEREELWFSADGIRLRALKPFPGAWAFLFAGFAGVATDQDRTHAILQFAHAALDPPSWLTVQNRMVMTGEMSPNMLGEICAALIAKWAPPEMKKQADQAIATARGNRSQRRAKPKKR